VAWIEVRRAKEKLREDVVKRRDERAVNIE